MYNTLLIKIWLKKNVCYTCDIKVIYILELLYKTNSAIQKWTNFCSIQIHFMIIGGCIFVNIFFSYLHSHFEKKNDIINGIVSFKKKSKRWILSFILNLRITEPIICKLQVSDVISPPLIFMVKIKNGGNILNNITWHCAFHYIWIENL